MRILRSLISLIIFAFITASAAAQPVDSVQKIDCRLVKPFSQSNHHFSGDGIHNTVGELLDQPIRVQVVDADGSPVEGFAVTFRMVTVPDKATGGKIEKTVVYTDAGGIAENGVTLGSKSGTYTVSARIDNGNGSENLVLFHVHARESNWVFMMIIGLVGGLALFLFGMEMMSEGMKKTAGSKLRSILGTLTNNRIMAVGVGTFVTMVIQSSSATTVMLVSFVQAGLMSFGQSLGIILGADIGTTITAQLIAFKLTDYALLMIGVGFIAMFLSKSQKYKNIGETVLGFGVLFFGMYVMSNAMAPLRTYEPFIDVLLKLENPLLGILVGTIFTALIQSSSAFTGIIIVMATQGVITLEAGIPLLFGANIGTSITAALASINTGREAKRVALAHALFKVFGVVIFLWWIPYFADLIRWISPSGAADLTGTTHLADVVPRQIANAHTVFNVALTLIVLPFTNMAAKWIERLLPDIPEDEDDGPYTTKHLEESLISTPALALNLAKAETIRMAHKVQAMVEKTIQPFFDNDGTHLAELVDREAEINYLNDSINRYLMQISQESEAEERTEEIFQMMHCVTEIEQMGDLVARRIVPLAEKKIDLNVEFSEAGKEEIMGFHLRTMKQISRAVDVFKEFNLKDARRMEKKYKKYRMMEMDLRRTHYDRLRENVPEALATSRIHLDLIESLKRISSHATNIARIFMEPRAEEEAMTRETKNHTDENEEEMSK